MKEKECIPATAVVVAIAAGTCGAPQAVKKQIERAAIPCHFSNV